eukprot:6516057-Prymnesium_polylepis.1
MPNPCAAAPAASDPRRRPVPTVHLWHQAATPGGHRAILEGRHPHPRPGSVAADSAAAPPGCAWPSHSGCGCSGS